MILVFILYAMFGLTFTLGKINLFYGRPFFIVGLRMLISSTAILSYIYLGRLTCRPKLEHWQNYLQIALFGIFFPYGLRAWGLQYTTSTKAAFLFTLMPFFTALFAYFFHKEKLTYLKSVGLILGFTGMLPTLFTGSLMENIQGNIAFFSLPELAIVLAVASFGYNLIAIQNLVKHKGCAPILANGISSLIGGFLAFSTSMLTEPVKITGNYTMFFSLVAAQILISNIICLNLQAHLLKTYNPTFMAFAGFLSPLFAALYGYILLGEPISLNYIISFFIVLIGLVIYHYDEIFKTNV